MERKMDDLFEATAAGSKWGGTATCTVKMDNGKTKKVSVSCSGEASYNDAKKRLESKISGEVNSSGGKIQGSINFSIKKEF